MVGELVCEVSHHSPPIQLLPLLIYARAFFVNFAASSTTATSTKTAPKLAALSYRLEAAELTATEAAMWCGTFKAIIVASCRYFGLI